MNAVPDIITDRSRSNLTPGQMLIWAGQQRSPDVPLYNMAMNFTVAGTLDPKKFDAAFQSVVDRSDAMRTVFRIEHGVPQRVVKSKLAANVEHLDFSREVSPEASVRIWTQERCQRHFETDQVLFEAALIRVSDTRYVWYFNQHHLVSDAWSFGLIFRQVSDAYRAIGKSGKSPEVPPQFEAYANSPQSVTADQNVRDYWKQQLSTSVSPPRLYGEPSSAGANSTERVTRTLSATQCQTLKDLAQRSEFRLLTPHMSQYCLMATVLYAYLYRVTNQGKLAVGCPAHNRPSMELKQTIGLFIELYPQQVEVEPGDMFATLFQKVHNAAGLLLRNAQPGACKTELHGSFNVVLNYITAAFGDFAELPMRSEWLHPGYGDPGHDLRLQVHDFDDAGELQLHFDFSTNVFSEAARSDAIEHFLRMLDAIVKNPGQAIDDVDLVPGTERRLLFDDEHAASLPATAPATLATIFESQASQTPTAPAIKCGSDELTYGELDQRVVKLTGHLKDKGLKAGDVVTICMKRSPELVVSMLAVTKLGAIWVPLDPSYPDKRVQFIVEDAAAAMLLTDASNIDRFPDQRTICVDQIELSHGNATDSNAETDQPNPNDPAYMIYTSGSTGQPKGVVISHRAIVHYVEWATKTYVGDQLLSFPLFSPISFDLTLTSIFVPLLSGGRIVIYPESAADTDLAILDVLQDNSVDVIKLTPSHLLILQEHDLSHSKVTQLILGGENLRREVAERTMRSFGNRVTLHNEYGPTEATVGCILHTYDPAKDTAVSVPIGRPIENMTAYVLNDRLQPCPIGVPGELFLAGVGLANGYLNRTELTAEKFIDNPFEPGTRMYRTGDLARIRRSGTYEYLGRRDHQVKIRGSRIETGEVEAALLTHSAIEACVVDVHRTESETDPNINYCHRCGLPSNYPDAKFDEKGVCQQCTAFDAWQQKADRYFKTMDELRSLFDESRARQERTYDCLALLSGGKDSTYALCQLVEMGLNVLAFTLDNGYISQQAKDNIDRVVATMNVDHVYGSTPAMNAIFVDSLKRHANVCNGCFKTIYTLSVQTAKKHGIPFIVTGLSRGQFFETRLTEELFSAPKIDVELIDLTILDARKAYHRVDDAVSQLMDVEVFKDDRIFDEVRFVDFYRYCPVELDDMLEYLDKRVPWIRPSDTGRSTNCLINDAGIHFHKKRRGFHNYAFPYSWDVRMGHKTRDAALAELNDEIDEDSVLQILDEIGFDEPIAPPTAVDQLVAWYVSSSEIAPQEIRTHLQSSLPRFMVPTNLVRIEQVPLTHNGKVDREQLPAPITEQESLSETSLAPRTRNERVLAEIWAGALRLQTVGIRDHFIDLGGDSITAIQIVGRANRAGLLITVDQLFDAGCIEALAQRARESGALAAEQGLVSGDVKLTPIQQWFFNQEPIEPNHWNQTLLVELDREIDAPILEAAFREVITHHDALRLSFSQSDLGQWRAQNETTLGDQSIVETHDLSAMGREQTERRLLNIEDGLIARLDLSTGSVVGAALIETDGRQKLLLTIHHLTIDAMSWPILLSDLTTAYDALSKKQSCQFPPKTTSFQQWAEFVSTYANTNATDTAAKTWLTPQRPKPSRLPVDNKVAIDKRDNRGERKVSGQLSIEDTRVLLERTVPALRVRVHEILIAVLGVRLSQWTGSPNVQIDVETHGRENLSDEHDLSRTVGWFTSMFPLAFSVGPSDPLQRTLTGVQTKMRDIANHGLDFGFARYLSSDETVRQQLAELQSEVVFNYLGAIEDLLPGDGWIRYSDPLKLSRGPNGGRAHLIEVNSMICDGQLQVDWAFHGHFQQPNIQEQASAMMDDLRQFIHSDTTAQTSSADAFPLAKLDNKKFDKLANLLQKTDGQRGSQ